MNAIQYGKLKLVARLGELSPAMSREETGREGGRGNRKGTTPGVVPFHPTIIARYRKVAAHAAKLDAYREACGVEREVTIDGFVRFATGTENRDRRNLDESQRAMVAAYRRQQDLEREDARTLHRMRQAAMGSILPGLSNER